MKTNTGENTVVKINKHSNYGKIFKYAIIITVCAVILSVLFLFLANDAFAITAKNEEVMVEIPDGATLREASAVLKENGLIKSKTWFSAYLALRGKNANCVGGNYVLNKTVGFDGIYRAITKGQTKKHVSVTVSIPEGSTFDDIINIICEKNGISSREEMVETLNHGDFSKYKFLSEIKNIEESGAKYRLEGYLYPDTYCFFSDADAYAVIDKMLANFSRKFDDKYRKACKAQGLTVNEAVTLASMIIKEAKFVSDYPKVSSVFANRLRSASFGKRLDSDATLVYVLGRQMRSEDKELDSPYNTYRNGGLPPSPIGNPDINALSYAIYPDKTGYYYFVAGDDGKIFYSATYSGHMRNIEKAKNSSETQ
jgi:UPF0755 protein